MFASRASDRATDGAAAQTSDRPAQGAGLVQLRSDLAGLSYGEQLERVRPPRPMIPVVTTPDAPVQCDYPEVTETPRDLRTFQQIFKTPGMTLHELFLYAEAQADWHASPDLRDEDRTVIRELLVFARESAANLAGCGSMRTADLRDVPADEADFDALRTYARAVRQESPTVELSPTSDVRVAIEWGQALARLEAALGGVQLNAIMPQAQFEQLLASGYLQDFIDYVGSCDPLLHASDGEEIISYLDLRAERADPASYASRLPSVRNYHRFEKTALEALCDNFSYFNKDLPLTLILHAAHDYNGAFHRDPELTALITHPANLTLMIEGATTLEEVSSQLHDLAVTYGQNDVIDQVVIAGHGSARSIQLAGTVSEEDGEWEAHHERLSLESNYDATKAFLTELLSNMGIDVTQAPNRRVVFNACLTAANEVEVPLDPADPARAAEGIRAAIADEPSLARYFQSLADAGGRDVTSLGANASIGEVGLVDSGTGEIDIVSAEDPDVTGPKLRYVETGIEPHGVMMAVVECLGDPGGPQPCFDAMQRRLASSGTSWDATVIGILFKTILNSYTSNFQQINELVDAAKRLSDLRYRDGCYVSQDDVPDLHDALPAVDAPTIFTALSAHRHWQRHTALAGWQVWLRFDSSHVGDFLTELDGHTCRSAYKYVDIGFLHPDLPTMLPVASASSPSAGLLVLALLGTIRYLRNPEPSCMAFLQQALGSSETFPSSLDVIGLLDGKATEDEVLTAIGRGRSAPREAPPDANVDLDGDGTNDFRIEPMTATGVVTRGGGASVRLLPDREESRLGHLPEGTDLILIGRYGAFWVAFEYADAPGGVAFTQSGFVEIQ